MEIAWQRLVAEAMYDERIARILLIGVPGDRAAALNVASRRRVLLFWRQRRTTGGTVYGARPNSGSRSLARSQDLQ